MLRTMAWTLRQRRYQALALLMVIVAIACVSIGTFEIHRLREKIHGNDLLRANARAATSALTTALVPLTGRGPAPGDSIRFCRVSVTGRYDAAGQEYVGNQNQGGHQGFFVLTPLRTADGVLLIARAFVAATSHETRPHSVSAPPSGTVHVVGRLYPAQNTSDHLGELGHREITAINPTEQAGRLGRPTYQAYLALDPEQPGDESLLPLPKPELSNPTGGAGEVQLLSYVVQWYVFALLALMAPFFFARGEAKEAQRRYLGIDPDGGEFDAITPVPERLALGAERGVGSAASGELVRRADGTLARRDGAVSPNVARAEQLAHRYGLTLGPDPVAAHADEDDLGPLRRGTPTPHYLDSAPYRSADGFHGSYNDHLWQLALADGEAPDVDLDGKNDDGGTRAGDGLKVYGPRASRPQPDPDAER